MLTAPFDDRAGEERPREQADVGEQRVRDAGRVDVGDPLEEHREHDHHQERRDQGPGEADARLLVPGPQLALGEHDDQLPPAPQLAQHRHRVHGAAEDELGRWAVECLQVRSWRLDHPLLPGRRPPAGRPRRRALRPRHYGSPARRAPGAAAPRSAAGSPRARDAASVNPATVSGAGGAPRRRLDAAPRGGDVRRRPVGRPRPARPA